MIIIIIIIIINCGSAHSVTYIKRFSFNFTILQIPYSLIMASIETRMRRLSENAQNTLQNVRYATIPYKDVYLCQYNLAI